MLTKELVVLNQTDVQEATQKFKTLYMAREGEFLIDLMITSSNPVADRVEAAAQGRRNVNFLIILTN